MEKTIEITFDKNGEPLFSVMTMRVFPSRNRKEAALVFLKTRRSREESFSIYCGCLLYVSFFRIYILDHSYSDPYQTLAKIIVVKHNGMLYPNAL